MSSGPHDTGFTGVRKVSVRIEIGKKYIVYAVTEYHVVIRLNDMKRAIVDLRDLSVRNFGISEYVIARVLEALADTSVNLFRWLKVSAK
jgi:hypothetical protein